MQNFDTSQDIILEDERVLLRPLQLSDVDNLEYFSLHDPAIWTFSSIEARGRENLANYIAMAIENREKGSEYPFVVFDKKTNEYAGSTRFYDIQNIHKTVQLGYTWYGSKFHGSGLNKHCKFLLLNYAFGQMKMERVEFRANNLNERSIAAMKSIGCTVDGILRSNMQNLDGTRRDSIVLSILKNEWESGVKEKLQEQIEKIK